MKIEIWMVMLLVLVLYAPSIASGWAHLDDYSKIKDPLVQNTKITEIFFKDSVQQSIYAPLTYSSLAIEYRFFGDNAGPYHFTNIVLHGIVVYLVYQLILTMGFGEATAVLSAAIFGLHPMRVESVAWIIERKDLLYSIFYLMGLTAYVRYLRSAGKKKRFYIFSLVWCSMALLSKPMALSFPLILILFDWLFQRPLRRIPVWIEKIPFFLVSIMTAGVSFLRVANDFGQTHPVHFATAPLYLGYSIVFYPVKFLFPVNLSPLYQFPEPVDLTNPAYCLAMALAIVFFASLWLLRQDRLYLFASWFYILSTFFLWRLNNEHFNPVADRFMYLPSLGFIVYLSCRFGPFLAKRAGVLWLLAILVFYATSTLGMLRVWKDPETLWTHVINTRTSNISEALFRRADWLEFLGNPELAEKDLTHRIKIDPFDPWVYKERALLHIRYGNKLFAAADCVNIINLYVFYEWQPDDLLAWAQTTYQHLMQPAPSRLLRLAGIEE